MKQKRPPVLTVKKTAVISSFLLCFLLFYWLVKQKIRSSIHNSTKKIYKTGFIFNKKNIHLLSIMFIIAVTTVLYINKNCYIMFL